MFFFKKKEKEGQEEMTRTNEMKNVFTREFFGKTITVEQGEVAKQSDGAVLVRYEDTTVLGVAQASRQMSQAGFFPLTVVFQEKMYAAGRVPGSFSKREGRPSLWGTLTSRLIDRPLRPLFPEDFLNEVQSIIYTLSNDDTAPIEMASLFAASLSLCISPIPFNGPVAGVFVGRINGEFVINPERSLWDKSELLVAVAGTKKAINMVEAEGNEVSEEVMAEAIIFGHKAVIELCEFQEDIARQVGVEKFEYETLPFNQAVFNEVSEMFKDDICKTATLFKKQEKYAAMDAVKAAATAHFEAKEFASDDEKKKTLKSVIESIEKIEQDNVRKLITVDKIRPDGRHSREIRTLNSQIDLIPRVHGNAMFTRGETQAMSFVTLGALGDHQLIDDVVEVGEKHFMHHYNFPQFSVGSTGRYNGASRRELGHGALGERALMKVLPTLEEFPYTVRCVSEILESNGSTSQASICASSMALMAAGVPIKAQIAGCAMGLIMDGENYTVLTDIQGLEDHLGDMDFKVAGTRKGICAIQMDIKIDGITYDILREAIMEARAGRMQILDNMDATISTHRDDLSQFAPKFEVIKIPTDKIKVVIGKGGEMIDKIIAECDNVKIDISEEGQVSIYHMDRSAISKAVGIIKGLTREIEMGEIFDNAKVFRIEPFGAFVKLTDKHDGLIHISNLAEGRVEKVEDVVKIGDSVKVKVIKIEPNGKIQVSLKDAK